MASSVLSKEEEIQVKTNGYYFEEVLTKSPLQSHVPAHLADEIVEFETEGMDQLIGMLGETLGEDCKAEEIAAYVEKLQSYLEVLEAAVLQDMPEATSILSLVERRIEEGMTLAQAKILEEEDDDESDEEA